MSSSSAALPDLLILITSVMKFGASLLSTAPGGS